MAHESHDKSCQHSRSRPYFIVSPQGSLACHSHAPNAHRGITFRARLPLRRLAPGSISRVGRPREKRVDVAVDPRWIVGGHIVADTGNHLGEM